MFIWNILRYISLQGTILRILTYNYYFFYFFIFWWEPRKQKLLFAQSIVFADCIKVLTNVMLDFWRKASEAKHEVFLYIQVIYCFFFIRSKTTKYGLNEGQESMRSNWDEDSPNSQEILSAWFQLMMTFVLS